MVKILVDADVNPLRNSPAQTRRIIRELLQEVPENTTSEPFEKRLAKSVRDTYRRKGSRQTRTWPRKKQEPPATTTKTTGQGVGSLQSQTTWLLCSTQFLSGIGCHVPDREDVITLRIKPARPPFCERAHDFLKNLNKAGFHVKVKK